MVSSLSGIMEEVTASKEALRIWNLENAERKGKVFLNVEGNVKPEDAKNVDVVIGIVDNWIENAVFVERCISEGKQVLLLFNAYQDPENTIASEYGNVNAFRDKVQGQCHCTTYKGTAQLKQLVEEEINKI